MKKEQLLEQQVITNVIESLKTIVPNNAVYTQILEHIVIAENDLLSKQDEQNINISESFYYLRALLFSIKPLLKD